jgi:hypothetical protein
LGFVFGFEHEEAAYDNRDEVKAGEEDEGHCRIAVEEVFLNDRKQNDYERGENPVAADGKRHEIGLDRFSNVDPRQRTKRQSKRTDE